MPQCVPKAPQLLMNCCLASVSFIRLNYNNVSEFSKLFESLLKRLPVGFGDQPINDGGKGFQYRNENVRQQHAAKKALDHSSGFQPSRKLFVPCLGIILLHLPAWNFILKEEMNLFKSNFTSMQRHAH